MSMPARRPARGETEMRRLSSVIAMILSTMLAIASAHAGEIEDVIRKALDMKNLSPALLSDNYNAAIRIGDQVLYLDKKSAIELHTTQAKMIDEYKIDLLNIKSIQKDNNFAVVSYSYSYSIKAGASNITGTIEAHSILEKGAHGWRFLYEVGTQ